tara:strand:- start:524 stop:751 length:228 start_codon:yes stop_codon:yes gene_type:complete
MKKDSQKSKKNYYLYFLGIIIVIGLVVYVNDIDIFSMIGIDKSLVGGNNITLNHKTSFKIPTNVENLIDNALNKF